MINLKAAIEKTILVLLILFIIFFIIASIYVVYVYSEYYTDRILIFEKINDFVDELKRTNETDITLGKDEKVKNNKTVFLDRENKIIAQYSPQKHKLIELQNIPYFVSKGFIIVEDKRFFYHGGINVLRLGLGVVKNIITLGHAPGGSTISQQLAKILFTNQNRTIKRKIYEFFCTLDLEKRFTKNEILQIYLNSIYLGHGVYGIESASNFYFGKNSSELNIAEAALLIGMNRGPELYTPIRYPERARRIQNVVLNQFVKANLLTESEKNMEIDRFWKKFDKDRSVGNQSFWKTEINKSGYVTEYVRQVLEKEFTQEEILEGGITVETTIDIKKQMLAQRIVDDQIDYIRDKIASKIEKYKLENYNINDYKKLQATLVSIDYKKGEVLVMIGGSGYSFNNQLNRAIKSYRPIGSSVKPFVYSIALGKKQLDGVDVHPFSKFKDEKKTYKVNGKNYTPENYYSNHKYGDMVTVYDAFTRSLNTISIKVFDMMEKKDLVELLQKAAFLNNKETKKRIPEVLSLALGTCELSTIELATAYSIFCRGGKSIKPVIIKKIYDNQGNVYFDYTKENNEYFKDLVTIENRETEELINPEVAYEIAEMMRGVFDKGGTGYWPAYLTGMHLIAYGKTGTSQEYKDGWFAGFVNNEVVVSWVGMDDNKSLLLPGASTAGMIWCDYQQRANNLYPVKLERPMNMKYLNIDPETGLEAVKNCPVKMGFYFWNDGPTPEKCYIHDGDIF